MSKNFLDFVGLSAFKTKIVEYIDAQDSDIVDQLDELLKSQDMALTNSEIDTAIANYNKTT